MITLNEYLEHTSCIDCKLAVWENAFCTCPLLERKFVDDVKARTTKRSDCPIKKFRRSIK